MAKNMCGKVLVCPESGEQGFLCRCVYITEELDVIKELYISIKNDRTMDCPVIIYGNWAQSDNGTPILDEDSQNKIYIDI